MSEWIHLSHGERVFKNSEYFREDEWNTSQPNWHKTFELLEQKSDKHICIWNANEAGGYYPWLGVSNGVHDKLLYLIHKNIHPENAPNTWYVSCDLNLSQNYSEWHKAFFPDSPQINVKPYPFAAVNCFFSRYKKYDHWTIPDESKKYKLICLVNQPKINRILTLRELAGREGFIYSFKGGEIGELHHDGSNDTSYFERLVNKWKGYGRAPWRWSDCGNLVHFFSDIEQCDNQSPRDFSNENFDQTKQIRMTDVFHLPEQDNDFDDYHDFFVPLEWMESHIELIHESYCTRGFMWSDKVCKSIWYLKPFLVVGCQGWYKHFEDLGFKLYDEIFDYSFDNIRPYNERWKAILKECDKILNMSHKELTQKTLDIREKMIYNKKLMEKKNVNMDVFSMAETIDNDCYI